MAGIGAAMGESAVVGFFSVILIMALIGGFRLISRLSRKAYNLPRELAVKGATSKLAKLEAEEVLYEKSQQEYDSGNIRSGLFAKAEATAKSTEGAAIRAQYIQLRFELLAAEAEALHAAPSDEPAVGDVLAESASEYDITCPFCQSNLRQFGRCGNCGNTVDECVLQAHK